MPTKKKTQYRVRDILSRTVLGEVSSLSDAKALAKEHGWKEGDRPIGNSWSTHTYADGTVEIASRRCNCSIEVL